MFSTGTSARRAIFRPPLHAMLRFEERLFRRNVFSQSLIRTPDDKCQRVSFTLIISAIYVHAPDQTSIRLFMRSPVKAYLQHRLVTRVDTQVWARM